jgi:metal-responsive CopG/Arc/MetJ family transcriptional regulator
MSKSIKLDSELWQRVTEHSQKAGYSSPEEFVVHVLERELERPGDAQEEDDKEVERRLKGLGYLE